MCQGYIKGFHGVSRYLMLFLECSHCVSGGVHDYCIVNLNGAAKVLKGRKNFIFRADMFVSLGLPRCFFYFSCFLLFQFRWRIEPT